MARLLKAHAKDLGGFTVSRILPHQDKKMVGPFIFFDRMGPADFPAGKGVNVRPHPHIGLATISYLFQGSMLHRDSLGSVQEIFPGDVNWMTAGKGIVHSERETLEVRSVPHKLDGIQCWIALPREMEEIEPDFTHVQANGLPCIYRENIMLRLIAGEAYGRTAPVRTFSPMFYIDAVCAPDARLESPDSSAELAVYLLSGKVRINDEEYGKDDFVLLEKGEEIEVLEHSRFMMLGGEKFDPAPHISWNFVAHDRETIKQAETRWRAGEFPTIPGDDEEFIPL